MKNISVIGAGTMGNGIAQSFAQSEYEVQLIDLNTSILESAKREIEKNLERMVKKSLILPEVKDLSLNRIHYKTQIETGIQNSDFIIEAATEKLEIKLELFRQMDKYSPKKALLATNTSSISITRLASVTERPDKIIGMHFMNPVPVMKLVEVINGLQTSKETQNQVFELAQKLGKIPVRVNDYPGFISNRILLPMINEAIFSLMEGVAGIEEIDSIMTLGMAHPMGPLYLADFIGLDVCLSILEVLYQGFKNPKYAPCPLLVNMVNSGFLGIKTGKGFYTYSLESKEKKVSDLPFLFRN